MAELLVKATSAIHPDPTKDERGCYKKGDIVVVMEDGHEWGREEGLPTFVIVKVPGIAASTVQSNVESWERFIDYEIVQQNLTLDGARFRIFVTVPGAANARGLTREQVESWIEKWGGTVVSDAANEVRFDITIESIYKSEGFWSAAPSSVGIVITETGYVQATGIHTATIDITGSSVPAAAVRAKVIEAGATIISFASGIATVTFERQKVREAFMRALRDAENRTLVRRRHYFASADVDAAIAAGGSITVTPAQIAARILDKAA